MTASQFFDSFKRDLKKERQQKSVPQVYFQIFFDKKTARLLTVDKDANAVNVDYRNYSGITRGILKAIDTLKEQSKKTINWGEEESGINLTNAAFLIWQLKRCDNFIDERKLPVSFSEKEGTFVLQITGEQQLECSLSMMVDGQLLNNAKIISELHAIHDAIIYPVKQAGVDHATLTSFETLILPSELRKYLSLFCSYCPDIEISYEDYRVITGEDKLAKPALIIEKIAPDNSLFLKTNHIIPDFEPDFMEQYEITHIVSIDVARKLIFKHRVKVPSVESPSTKIRKCLLQLKSETVEQSLEFYQDENFFIIESPFSQIFVQEALPSLLPEFAIFGSEKLKPYRVLVTKPELRYSIDHGIDFFEGSADLLIGEEHFSLFEALHQFGNKSYIQLSDGTKAILDHDYVKKLERIFQKSDQNAKASFFDLPLIDELLEKRIENEAFNNAKKVFSGFLELKNLQIEPPNLNATLRPYQIDGYKWLKYLNENKLGGCLADDMGLGKTLQALSLLSSVYPDQQKTSLIIVPKSLVFNWQNEISRFCNGLEVAVYHGVDRDLGTAMQKHLVLSTYGTVRNDIEILKENSFYYVILDESQFIKNHESQISRAVSLLQAEHRLALSGTPIENNLSELYALFRFLNPAMFGNVNRFNRQYLIPIQQEGNQEIALELKKKTYPFILRRLKKDVLQDLPDKIEKLIYVEMTDNHRRFYEQRRQFFYDAIRNRIEAEGVKKSQFFILQAITVLRQIASIPEVKSDGQIISPKRALMCEMLEEAFANDHKVLLFANFLGVLEYLGQDVSAIGIDYEVLTGSTRNREAPVKRFQTDSDCKIFLMTLKTGGQGLNLTAADTIFIFDPWWNLAAENQAIDRAHRIGQRNTVFSYKLITKDTIEERILLLQNKKKAVFESVFSDESISYHNLVEEDIDYLMS